MNRKPGQQWWDALRIAVALVWLYQGLWLKVIAVDERHLRIVAGAFRGIEPRWLLGSIGLVEACFALSLLFRWRLKVSACLQILTIIGMNGAGIFFSAKEIPDPVGMVLMNVIFCLVIWGVAKNEQERTNA